MQGGAIIGLLSGTETYRSSRATAALERLSGSPDVRDRLAACSILARSGRLRRCATPGTPSGQRTECEACSPAVRTEAIRRTSHPTRAQNLRRPHLFKARRDCTDGVRRERIHRRAPRGPPRAGEGFRSPLARSLVPSLGASPILTPRASLSRRWMSADPQFACWPCSPSVALVTALPPCRRFHRRVRRWRRGVAVRCPTMRGTSRAGASFEDALETDLGDTRGRSCCCSHSSTMRGPYCWRAIPSGRRARHTPPWHSRQSMPCCPLGQVLGSTPAGRWLSSWPPCALGAPPACRNLN